MNNIIMAIDSTSRAGGGCLCLRTENTNIDIIQNSSFTNCNSHSGSGGAIMMYSASASANMMNININKVKIRNSLSNLPEGGIAITTGNSSAISIYNTTISNTASSSLGGRWY
jgi:hypothetical protein